MGSSPSTEHPTALLPSLPSGRGAQQVPGARGPQAGPAREHSSAPGDAAQRQGHMVPAALLPSAIPAGPGAELTGGPGSPRGAAPSTSPGRPCRDRGQLLWDGPRGGQSFPAPCGGCTALGHPWDLQEGRGARETRSHSPFPLGHPSPPARIKKKQVRADLDSSHAPFKQKGNMLDRAHHQWYQGACMPCASPHAAQRQQQPVHVYVCVGRAGGGHSP